MLLQIRKILGKKIRNVICDDSFAPNRPSSHILNPTRLLEISDLPSDFLSADACFVRSYSSMSVKKGMRHDLGSSIDLFQGCLADVCVYF